jgi:hypothetical protein
MSRSALLAAAVLFLAASAPAIAQTASVTARVAQGEAAAEARQIPGEGVLLRIALPDGRTQEFPGLGEELIPLSGKRGDPILLTRDIDSNGSDEIVIRASVPPKAGAIVIFRWDDTAAEFVPVDFTNDRDQTTPYLIVDFALPVRIDGDGAIMAEHMSVRQDGRKSYRVARYRWNGSGYSHSADN